MLFSTIGQGYIFLWMTAAGLLIGALYALAAGLRRLMEAGFWLSLVIDCLFGLGAALIFIAALVTASYGSVRLYELLGVATGLALFSLGPYPLMKRGTAAFYRAILVNYDRIRQNRLIKVIFR